MIDALFRLDLIERAAIRDKQLRSKSSNHCAPAQTIQLATFSHMGLMRFFRLWCRTQWKRERSASFHLDDENLDPTTVSVFPIFIGGYEPKKKKKCWGEELRIYVWRNGLSGNCFMIQSPSISLLAENTY